MYIYIYIYIYRHAFLHFIHIYIYMHQAKMLLAFFEGLIPPKNDNVPWRMLKILVAGGCPREF